MKLRMMASTQDPSTSYNPRWGILIPSPLPTHTHAVACHPFDPNALLSVENRLRYLPEHSINDLPIEQQAERNAGQAIVVPEMANLRSVELEARRIQSCPEVVLSIHGNPNANPLTDVASWRKRLGWAGAEEKHAREQFHRYTSLTPGMSRYVRGVQDRSIWDHELGEWQATTYSAVQEAKQRRDWVCAELERIDTLRYHIIADWKRKIDEQYSAERIMHEDKKRKRESDEDVEAPVTSPESQQDDDFDDQDDGTRISKRRRIRVITSVTPTARVPRPTIELPYPFSLQIPTLSALSIPGIPDSQTTVSSASTSPDDHHTRSQAPEPQSSIKSDLPAMSTHEENIHRYTFVLDIPTTDNQRVEWLKFLDKYEWNPTMISALRKFFCAEPTPNTSMTKRFLERLKEVCGTIEEVAKDEDEELEDGEVEEKRYRLLWDRKVKTLGDEVSMLATPVRHNKKTGVGNRKGRTLRRQQTHPLAQPTWVRTPVVSPLMGSDGDNSSDGNDGARRKKNVGKSKSIDIPALMKEYVASLSKGDRVEVPCDKCRALHLECRINSSSCKRCAGRHDRCVWNEVPLEEVRALGLLGEGEWEGSGEEDGEDDEEVQKSGRKRGQGVVASNPTKVSKSSSGRGSSGAAGAGGERRIRKKSVYDLPEDDPMDVDSTDEEVEEEWVPSP